MVANDPELRRAIAVKAGHARVADMTIDERRATTATARQARLAQIAAEIDPDGSMDPAELQMRIDARIRLHMADMALKSAKAKAAKRAADRDAAIDAMLAEAGEPC